MESRLKLITIFIYVTDYQSQQKKKILWRKQSKRNYSLLTLRVKGLVIISNNYSDMAIEITIPYQSARSKMPTMISFLHHPSSITVGVSCTSFFPADFCYLDMKIFLNADFQPLPRQRRTESKLSFSSARTLYINDINNPISHMYLRRAAAAFL